MGFDRVLTFALLSRDLMQMVAVPPYVTAPYDFFATLI